MCCKREWQQKVSPDRKQNLCVPEPGKLQVWGILTSTGKSGTKKVSDQLEFIGSVAAQALVLTSQQRGNAPERCCGTTTDLSCKKTEQNPTKRFLNKTQWPLGSTKCFYPTPELEQNNAIIVVNWLLKPSRYENKIIETSREINCMKTKAISIQNSSLATYFATCCCHLSSWGFLISTVSVWWKHEWWVTALLFPILQWHHVGSLKSAMVRVFKPYI